YEAIFRFVYKRVAEEDLTADLTAQVFEKAMLNLKRYRFQGVPFSAWLYRIAINEVNQHFRRSQRQRVISMERVQVGELFEEMEERDDESNLRRMLGVIQELKPEEVQFIELRFFEGMPFREIAAIYHITENNAKVRMHRLLQKLKQRMQAGRPPA
ncbi:MAG: sigma-70 family RNA polymerase sigma factor, partial [Bacteroidetes bacterium]